MGPVAPFLHIGVDCFGPMYVRSAKTSEFLVTNFRKVYGILFTCLVTRAIHLEFVEDLSGDQFLQALIRFKSQRGTPKLVVSDNGRNFTFVQPLLGHKVEINDPNVDVYFKQNAINWHFIPAYSPWEGGV